MSGNGLQKYPWLLNHYLSIRLILLRGHELEDQGDNEEDNKYKEQDLRDLRRNIRDSSKSE